MDTTPDAQKKLRNAFLNEAKNQLIPKVNPVGVFKGWKPWTPDIELLMTILKQNNTSGTGSNNPSITITPSPLNPNKGEDVTLLGEPRDFRTPPDQLQYSWCIDGANYNPVLAGGSVAESVTDVNPLDVAAFNLSQTDKLLSNQVVHACCTALTRTPKKDADADGMDDDWEVRYFGSIQAADPDDDPDNDGFLAARYQNVLGQYINLTPKLVSSNNRTFVPGNVAGGRVGIVELTNLEEYILDTNPLRADTDADGIKDEADYMGVGGGFLTFRNEKEAGKNYEVISTAMGVNTNGTVSIVSQVQQIATGENEPLSVELTTTPTTPVLGRDVSFRAEALGSTLPDAALLYDWEVNIPGFVYRFSSQTSEEVQNATTTTTGATVTAAVSGRGLNEVSGRISPDVTPGQVFQATVKVTDPATGRQANKSVDFVVAVPWTITSDYPCAETDPTVADCAFAGQQVTLTATQAQQSLDLNNFHFAWYVKDTLQRTVSGADGTSVTFTVDPAETESTIPVRVEIFDTQVASDKPTFVAQYAVKLKKPEVAIVADSETNPETIYVQQGKSVTISALHRYFPGSDNGSFVPSYLWFIDGERVVGTETNANLEFNAPESAQIGTIHDVEVRITDAANQQGSVANKHVEVHIGSAPATTSVARSYFGRVPILGSVFTAVSSGPVGKFFSFVAATGGIFFVVVVVLKFVERSNDYLPKK